MDGVVNQKDAFFDTLGRLFVEIRASVLGSIRRLLRGAPSGPEILEEIFQEGCLRAFIKWGAVGGNVPDKADVQRWVMAACRYMALNQRRKLNRQCLLYLEDIQETWSEPHCWHADRDAEALEARDVVHAFLALLTDVERNIVVRIDLEGASVSDVARETGMSQSGVRKRRWRAHVELKRLQRERRRNGGPN